MGNGRRRLRILHISDLHARGDRENERWRRRRVLGDAWEENLETLLQDGGFDLVCFTGDATD
ncbi:MAG: metallophosphoesterase [Holophagales bacterium]|nr:metallophosphoesterase [Holophagales bacterium]